MKWGMGKILYCENDKKFFLFNNNFGIPKKVSKSDAPSLDIRPS
jgi:hypothetical protein